MSISYEQLLMKIEQQVGQAKRAPSSQMREHVYAIRTLCDLALDSQQSEAERPARAVANSFQPTPVYQPPVQPQQTVSIPKDKPLQTDDGSNGDSLFDF